jgi:hypothetical protein
LWIIVGHRQAVVRINHSVDGIVSTLYQNKHNTSFYNTSHLLKFKYYQYENFCKQYRRRIFRTIRHFFYQTPSYPAVGLVAIKPTDLIKRLTIADLENS